jgi:hypothetical protein
MKLALAPWHVALGGALVGTAVVLAVLVPRTVKHLEGRGRVLEQQAASSTGATGSQIRAMQARLEAFAEATTRRAADDHMRTGYGITEARVQALNALATRLGVS